MSGNGNIMIGKKTFTAFCETCGIPITHQFTKDELISKGGGLYSAVFLHKSLDNRETHAILAYFDEHLDNRGGEDSRVIKDKGTPLEVLPETGECINEETKKLESNVFYEWLINEYIDIFRNMKFIGKKKVGPALTTVLEQLKKQDKIFTMFELICDVSKKPIIRDLIKLSDVGDWKIVFDLKKTDIYNISYSELKSTYQTLFDHIKTQFMEENIRHALDALRKLGFKVIMQWREIVKLGLSEDILRILEASEELEELDKGPNFIREFSL